MAGDEVGEVLYADHALEKRLGQVADLTRDGSDERGEEAQPQRHRCRKPQHQPGEPPGKQRRQRPAECALNGFLRAHMWSQLVLAEAHPAKERRAVAAPGGKAGRQQGLPPDIAHADDHDDPEQHAGVTQPREGVERADAGHVPVNDARKQGEVQAEHKQHRIDKETHVEPHEHGLRRKVDNHHPQRTPCVQLLHALAVFVSAQPAGDAEIQNTGHGEGHARGGDGDEDKGGFDTVLQGGFLAFSV